MIQVNGLLRSTVNERVCIERVLWTDPSSDVIVTIDCTAKLAMPTSKRFTDVQSQLNNGIIACLLQDPYILFADPKQISVDARDAANRAWRAIETIVTEEPYPAFDKKARAALIAASVTDKLASRASIYLYLFRYWKGGKSWAALLPQFSRCGGPGKTRLGSASTSVKRGRKPHLQMLHDKPVGINVNEEVRAKIQKVALQVLKSNPQASIRSAYTQSLSTEFALGETIGRNGVLTPVLPEPTKRLSYTQFQYWARKAIGADERLRARVGEHAYTRDHRALLGNSTSMAQGPGSLYQVDAHIGKIYLVSSIDRTLVIGMPVLYVIIDVFSRMVVGFSVGLEGPSWRGALLAIENAVSNKADFCRSLGIPGITEAMWPAQSLPTALLADNGEFHGYNSDLLAEHFNVRMVNTPPYRPDWKGIVERHFRLVKERISDWLETTVRLNRRDEKPVIDTKLALDLNQLRRLLALCFLEHNTTKVIKKYPLDADMLRDEVIPRPLDLWNWGIQNRTGQLRQFPTDLVRAYLLPSAKASVTSSGIQLETLTYDHPLLRGQWNWYERARREGVWRETVSYDPLNTGQIYLHLDRESARLEHPDILRVGDSALLKCSVREIRGFENARSFDEIGLHARLESLSKQIAEHEGEQPRADFRAQALEIRNEAQQQNKAARGSAAPEPRKQNIAENRREEKALERTGYELRSTGLAPEGAVVPPATQPHFFDPTVDSLLDDLVEFNDETT